MKSVQLKAETAKLLKRARLLFVEETKDSHVTDDKAIRRALEVYTK